MFIKQAIHASEPHGTETAHYIVKLTLYQVFLFLARLGYAAFVLAHQRWVDVDALGKLRNVDERKGKEETAHVVPVVYLHLVRIPFRIVALPCLHEFGLLTNKGFKLGFSRLLSQAAAEQREPAFGVDAVATVACLLDNCCNPFHHSPFFRTCRLKRQCKFHRQVLLSDGILK